MQIIEAMVKKTFLLTFALLVGFFSCEEANQNNAQSGQDAPYRRGTTMITPSSQWREALPSGNGTIGAMVYGSIGTERIMFNHNLLWYGGIKSELPDMSTELSVVRKWMLAGEYGKANMHYVNKMIEKGFNGRHAFYHPAFDMILTMQRELLFDDYSRTLDFETGEVEVKWRDGEISYSRRLFVSIPDDISVVSLKADKKNSINGVVTLDIHDLKDAVDRRGRLFDPKFTYKTIADGDFLEFCAGQRSGQPDFIGACHWCRSPCQCCCAGYTNRYVDRAGCRDIGWSGRFRRRSTGECELRETQRCFGNE